MRLSLILSVCVFTMIGGKTLAQSQYESSTDFAKYAMKLRENALLKIEPKVIMSPTKTVFTGDGPRYMTGPSLMGRGCSPERRTWTVSLEGWHYHDDLLDRRTPERQ